MSFFNDLKNAHPLFYLGAIVAAALLVLRWIHG